MNSPLPSWPAREHDLLQAAFLPDERALEAWEFWHRAVDWNEHVHPAEYRLLPQLFRNLGQWGVDHPLLQKFKGVARRAWTANQRELAPLAALTQTGMNTIVLPPYAFSLRQADHVIPANLMLSLLVRRPQLMGVKEALAAAGWQPTVNLPKIWWRGYAAAAHELVLANGNDRLIKLSWIMAQRGIQDPYYQELWEYAETAHHGQAVVLVPDATCSLHWLLAQLPVVGAKEILPSRGDLALNLWHSQDEIEWQRLSELLAVHPATARTRRRWRELAAILPDLVTHDPFPTTSNGPAPGLVLSRAEPPPGSGLVTRWRFHWSRLRQTETAPVVLLSLPGYFIGYWSLANLKKLPGRIWRSLRYRP